MQHWIEYTSLLVLVFINIQLSGHLKLMGQNAANLRAILDELRELKHQLKGDDPPSRHYWDDLPPSKERSPPPSRDEVFAQLHNEMEALLGPKSHESDHTDQQKGG
jgi:hypothetical protein